MSRTLAVLALGIPLLFAGCAQTGVYDTVYDHSTKVEMWIEGPPQKKWYGLRTWKLRKIEVQTWRCQRCFYLESYAPE